MVNHDDTAPAGYRLLTIGEIMMKGDLIALSIRMVPRDKFCEIVEGTVGCPVSNIFIIHIRKIGEEEW